MDPSNRGPWDRVSRGVGALAARGLGRSSLIAACAASFLSARSPGAALVFVLLPAYIVLTRGDFAGTSEDGHDADPSEIPLRLAAAILAALASTAALYAGNLLARRFLTQSFPAPWGLAAACTSSSLLLAAVHLPFRAAGGPKAGRTAAGAFFALSGIAAAVSALPAGSLYAAFLWLLYSGSAPSLYLPLVAGSALLAACSAAASWLVVRAQGRKS